jgi:hypothetical protein
MGPSDGACLLCGELESCDHIFFVCPLAKFMWACVRELLGTAWNPGGAGDFHSHLPRPVWPIAACSVVYLRGPMLGTLDHPQ